MTELEQFSILALDSSNNHEQIIANAVQLGAIVTKSNNWGKPKKTKQPKKSTASDPRSPISFIVYFENLENYVIKEANKKRIPLLSISEFVNFLKDVEQNKNIYYRYSPIREYQSNGFISGFSMAVKDVFWPAIYWQGTKSIRYLPGCDFKSDSMIRFSKKSLQTIKKEKIPEEVIQKLDNFVADKQGYSSESLFMSAVRDMLGKSQSNSIEESILKHAVLEQKFFVSSQKIREFIFV